MSDGESTSDIVRDIITAPGSTLECSWAYISKDHPVKHRFIFTNAPIGENGSREPDSYNFVFGTSSAFDSNMIMLDDDFKLTGLEQKIAQSLVDNPELEIGGSGVTLKSVIASVKISK